MRPLHEILAALIALCGNALLSLGMVLQKKNVGWFGYKGAKERKYRHAKYGWLFGFILMNLHPVFNYFALLGLPPNVVSAMIGTNVAFTSILAALILGERLPLRRLLALAVIFGSVGVLGFRGGAHVESLNPGWFYFFGALPLVVAILCWIFHRRLRGKAFPTFIAAVSGSLGGYMVLALKAIQVTVTSVLGVFASPYLYVFFLSAWVAFSLLQLAFKHGDVTTVSPADYGMQVLWPALSSYFVFGSRFDPVQIVCIGAITISIFLIPDPAMTKKTGAQTPSGS